jgi:hypothetical protein
MDGEEKVKKEKGIHVGNARPCHLGLV